MCVLLAIAVGALFVMMFAKAAARHDNQVAAEAVTTAEAAGKAKDKPFTINELGWRDVDSETSVGNGESIYVFGIDPKVPASEVVNQRIATYSPSRDGWGTYEPLVSKDRHKIFVREIMPKGELSRSPNGPTYYVGRGNLSAELHKAGLPQ
jgi:hypothetical protein